MNLISLDLNLLVAFEAILDARSVTRAAVQLGIRQPAMSASLARLREVFSDELFVRAAGEMLPTPKALSIAPGITRALSQLRDTLGDTLPFDPASQNHVFTVASTDYTSMVLLPELMREIARGAPKVELRVIGYDKDDIREMVDRGKIDLALGVFREPPERAVRRFLWEERFVGLARLGHPAIRDGTITLDDYITYPHALVSVRRDATGKIDRALSQQRLTRRVALTLPHMTVLPAILTHGDLLAAVPGRIARSFFSDHLQSFVLPLTIAPWKIEMLWNEVARKDAANAWLRNCVLKIAHSV